MNLIEEQDSETKSLDLKADNLERLAALFPDVLVEGRLDVERLLQELPGVQAESDAPDERFGLSWSGKRRARQLALTPSLGTLRPAEAESVSWNTTQNLLIEGDNLEVLKLLQRSYSGRVQLIYIDPPYNSGKDFVYPDAFQDGVGAYLRLTGQVDAEGQRTSSNSESSGRFHTAWLNMMYPRLRLARNLLRDDGMLWVSIDDREVHHLKVVLNELFGEENFLAQITWQRAYSPVNLKRTFSENHDFILCYAKNIEKVVVRGLKRTDEANARYSNPDDDPRGQWKSSDLSVGPAIEANIYEITLPSGRKVRPPAGYSWRLSKERFAEFVADRRIWFGPKGDAVPSIKRFLSEVKDRMTPLTMWPRDEVGDSQEATRELKKLFDDNAVFDYPKPVRLISRIVELSTAQNDIVLDFFAGSGTTAHATMSVNASDGGNRRFVLVQLPEPTGRQDFPSIVDIAKERIRRSAASVSADVPGFKGDVGFRVFKLDTSNIRTWDPDRSGMERSLLDNVEHLREGRTDGDVLYELLLKTGLDLCVPIEHRLINARTVYSVGCGVLMVCVEKEIGRNDVESLATGIVAWHRELKPAGETTVVFRDSAFADDVAKTNLTAILQQHGLNQVRSL